MPDYTYAKHPIFPLTEEIMFDTEVVKLESLSHAAIGSPASYQSTCPAPRYPVQELTTRKTLVSDNIDNLKEKRRVEYEDEVIGYTFTLNNMTRTQKNNLVSFFTSRKGMFENFYINYSYLFSNTNTLVRFDMDTLSIDVTHPDRYEATVTIIKALNHRYIPRLSTPRRKFTLRYKKSDLSALKTFFKDTAKGRETSYTFNPYQLSTYLENTNYTVRFNSDEFLERWQASNDYEVEVELITVN